MSKSISLAATAGVVHFVTEDGTRISLTPELADTLGFELPRKAAQARMLANQKSGIAQMTDALRALGYVWHVADPQEKTGWWEMNDVPVTIHCSYEAATRSLYSDLTAPLPLKISPTVH